VCGGHEYVIVSKPGSSNIVTIDGQPSTGVSVLFGLYVTDENGDFVVDFRARGSVRERHRLHRHELASGAERYRVDAADAGQLPRRTGHA
jgi:hypothetical protein